MTKINLPYNLQDGQKAYAAKVMENFNAILGWANAGAGSIDVDVEGIVAENVAAAFAELLAAVLNRYTKAEVNAIRAALETAISTGDAAVMSQLAATATSLQNAINSGDTTLQNNINALDVALRGLITAGDAALQQNINTVASTAATATATAQQAADKANAEKLDKPTNLSTSLPNKIYGLRLNADGSTRFDETGGGGHRILDENGLPVAQQPDMQFLGAPVRNVGDATVVDIAKGAKGEDGKLLAAFHVDENGDLWVTTEDVLAERFRLDNGNLLYDAGGVDVNLGNVVGPKGEPGVVDPALEQRVTVLEETIGNLNGLLEARLAGEA